MGINRINKGSIGIKDRIKKGSIRDQWGSIGISKGSRRDQEGINGRS